MNYQVAINDFEGPLDLLLHLVNSMKMDIYEIQTDLIITEYLNYIHSLQELNIDVASEFLLMASSLVHLKSKKLIGKSMEEEQEDSEFSIVSEEDLKTRLIEYQRYKMVTASFKEMEAKRSEVFTKVPENLKNYLKEKPLVNDGDVGVDDLIQAFVNLQERIHFKEPVHTKITKKEISVESRRIRIRDILKEKKRVLFEDLFDIYNKEYVVVTFLALLDMAKNQEVCVNQENNFERIWIVKEGSF